MVENFLFLPKHDLKSLSKKRWREKDGKLIHDGDCYFWDLKICTCGLIHNLIPYTEGSEHYSGDLWEDRAHMENQLYALKGGHNIVE